MPPRSLRPTNARVAFEQARPIFEAGKNDEIEPEDFHLTQLLTIQFKRGVREILEEIGRLGLPPRPAWVHLMGPCIERPTVLKKILLNHRTDLVHFRCLTARERRYRRVIHMWEFPSYVRENARPLQEVTLMRSEDYVNVATCRARLAQSGGDGLIYLMKLLTKVARDLLDPDELMPPYNIYMQRISGECIFILAQPDRVILSVTRGLHTVIENMMVWVCGTFRIRNENDICYSRVSLDPQSAVLPLTNLQPLPNTNTDLTNLLTRCWFPRDIIFTKRDFGARHRAIAMSYRELLRYTGNLVRYRIPHRGRVRGGVILLGRYIALIPAEIDHERNTVTWSCELRPSHMSEDVFKEALIANFTSGEWSSERATWERRYLAETTDQALRATTAVVCVGRRRPRDPLLQPALIY